MPTTGIMPTTIPRFIKSVEAKIKLSPPILNLQNLSRALYAKYKHLTKIKKNNKQISKVEVWKKIIEKIVQVRRGK